MTETVAPGRSALRLHPSFPRFALPMLLLPLLVLFGCRSELEKRDAHLEAAARYLDTNSPKKALIELRNALKSDPKNPDTNFRLADLLEKQRNIADAIFFYGEAHRLDPGHTEATLREAGLLIFDDPARSRDLVEEVLEREPAHAPAHTILSRLYLIGNDVDSALASVLTAVELDPEDPQAHLQVSKVHQARIRAREVVGQVVEDSLFEEAAAACDRAEPLFDEPVAWLAAIERAWVMSVWPGHEEQAAEAIRAAIESIERSGPKEELAKQLEWANGYASRVQNYVLLSWVLEKHVASFPGSYPVWLRLAALHRELADSQQAGDAVLKRMLEARPDDSQAHIQFAIAIAAREGGEEAIAHLRGALERGIDPPAILGGLYSLLRSLKRNEEAEAVAERLNREYRDHPRAVLTRASRALEENRADEVRDELRALASRNKGTDVQMMHAEVEYRLGNLPAALAATEAAIKRATFYPASAVRFKFKLAVETHRCRKALRTFASLTRRGQFVGRTFQILRARCLYETGRPLVARKLLETIVSDSSHGPQAVLEFARHEMKRDPEQVRALLEKALATRPANAALLSQLVKMELAAGQSKRVLVRLNEVIGSRPVTPAVILERARVLAVQGNLKAAQRDALQAFQASPNLPDAAGILVALYQAQGGVVEAISSFEEANAAGALQAPARLLLAKLHLQQGNEDRARALFEQVLTEQDDLATAQNDLAYLLAKRGESLDRALHLAQQAQREISDSPAVSDTLGYVFLRSELYDAAAQQFRYALDLALAQNNVQSVFHYHLGLALRGLGRSEDAADAFEAALGLDANFEDAAAALRAIRATGTPLNTARSSS